MMHNFISRLTALIIFAGVLFSAAGCGYHVGFMKHPQIDSLAVAPAVNETAIYNVASDMRFMMTEAIQQDGTYKLSDQRRADAIIYLIVKEAAFAEISDASIEDNNRYRPGEWSAKVKVDYRVIIPGRGEPLLQGSVTGNAFFQAPGDLESARLRAVRQACHVAAQKIVYNIAEGW